ncbi:hypothetical protein ACSSS7_008287 [Eimeria intestinalis]
MAAKGGPPSSGGPPWHRGGAPAGAGAHTSHPPIHHCDQEACLCALLFFLFIDGV